MTSEQIEMMVGDGRVATDFEGVTVQRVGGRQPWRVSRVGGREHFATLRAAAVRTAALLRGAA
jgi:hypothetical protein